MRISDWSSDVCSSDLGVPDPRGWTSGESRSPRFQAVASTVADYGKEPGKTPSTGAYDHSQEVVRIGHQIFERISGACADSSDSLVSFLENRCSKRGVYRSELLDFIGNFGASDRIRRSEEHTSELQSLMRNSYAVFCLKKKQKHTTQ